MLSELEKLCDLNLLEAIHFQCRTQPGSISLEEGGVLLVAGRTPFPVGFGNGATRVDPNVAATEVMERADEFFSELGRAYTVWVRGDHDADLEAAALERGATAIGNSPCMAIYEPIAEKGPGDGVTLRFAATVDDIEAVREINREAYESIGLPPEEADPYYARPETWLGPNSTVVIADLDGRPAATSALLMTARAGGLYWVGTRSDARGRGLGELCTIATTNAAFDQGAQVVTLQASVMGEPIYRRLGYTEYARQRWLLRNPAD